MLARLYDDANAVQRFQQLAIEARAFTVRDQSVVAANNCRIAERLCQNRDVHALAHAPDPVCLRPGSLIVVEYRYPHGSFDPEENGIMPYSGDADAPGMR